MLEIVTSETTCIIFPMCRYVKPPVSTLCIGNAWGEAALLLVAGITLHLASILQPIARFQGQATDVELARKEITNVKTELVRIPNRILLSLPVHYSLLKICLCFVLEN